ncbi:MAG: hypothetical protein M1821_005588 [Bathelium mastoideum]|nr:MAG: hypothetical protein M1821_005588 [Bathelium mastoideum]
MIIGAAVHTIGYHLPPAPGGLTSIVTAIPEQQIRFKKVQYVLSFFFVLVIGLIRLSILFFYKRIFRGKVFNISFWILVVTVTIWMVLFFFISIFECGTNIKANWGSFADYAEYCINLFTLVIAIAITDVILDVAVVILPLPFIWKLQMPTKQKLGVSLIFLFGLFSIAAGATRLAMNIDVNYLHHPGGVSPVLGLRADDVIGIVGFTIFWQLVQVGVAVVAANLLTVRPIFQHFPPESVLGSLRSKFSLSSLRTSSSKQEKSSLHSTDQLPLNEFDEYQRGHIETQNRLGSIKITHEVDLREQQV